MKGQSLVHLDSRSYSVGCQGEIFASLQRISPVSKEVCDFWGFQIAKEQSYISEPGLLDSRESACTSVLVVIPIWPVSIPYALKDGDDILP